MSQSFCDSLVYFECKLVLTRQSTLKEGTIDNFGSGWSLLVKAVSLGLQMRVPSPPFEGDMWRSFDFFSVIVVVV